MTSNGRDSSGRDRARRDAAPPRRRWRARPRSPSRRSAFCAMRALMSLSSAMSARRDRRRPMRGATPRPAGGKSHATRSNSERARTGFTSQPSKPLSAVCPKARRSNGENSTQAAPDPGRARGLRQAIGRLGPERAIDDDEVRRRRARSAPRGRSSRPSARSTLDARFGEARADRRRLERRIGDDEGARAVEDAAPSISTAPAGSSAAHSGSADGEGEDRPSARIVGKRQLAAHQADELARNRQAQPRALEAARVRAVALLETVEDRPPAVGRHAGPGVDDREPRRAPFAALDRDADAALIGEFDRIAGEVGQNLAQAQAVRARRSAARRR